MNIYENPLYMEDVNNVASLDLPWEKLNNKTIILSGATGLIGSFLTDVILEKDIRDGLNCTVFALGRDKNKAFSRFSKYHNYPHLVFFPYDVKEPFVLTGFESVDYVFHLASNTHPVQYATDPIGTITTNIIGLKNMLDFASNHHATRFAFASSNEIYGNNRGDVELFDEQYCGYLDSNSLRAGYPESKRCGEALCQAYYAQTGLDVVIPRFTRSYGPSMLMTDTKAISQFIKKGLDGEDIVLKSSGTQYYSYSYVSDAVSGFLTIVLCGNSGEAYNIADTKSDITLRNLAEIIASNIGKSVVYENPDPVESAGYSVATKARLDGTKLRELGWTPKYDIKSGIERTITILKQIS